MHRSVDHVKKSLRNLPPLAFHRPDLRLRLFLIKAHWIVTINLIADLRRMVDVRGFEPLTPCLQSVN